MKILVAFATERGGTEGLADAIGSDLRFRGHDVSVLPASAVSSVLGYDAVILGGAIYHGQWHPDAVRCVRTHKADLRSRPTWLFSSGPLDDRAGREHVKPVAAVRRAVRDCRAQGEITFGGRLMPLPTDTVVEQYKVRHHFGDFRNPVQVMHWVADIDAALRESATSKHFAATG